MRSSDEGGSMLIEILVVLLLISVLAAVILPSGFAFYRRAAVPLGPTSAPGCDVPSSRCQSSPSIWTLGRD